MLTTPPTSMRMIGTPDLAQGNKSDKGNNEELVSMYQKLQTILVSTESK